MVWLEFELRTSRTADKQSSNFDFWAVDAAVPSQLNFNKITVVGINLWSHSKHLSGDNDGDDDCIAHSYIPFTGRPHEPRQPRQKRKQILKLANHKSRSRQWNNAHNFVLRASSKYLANHFSKGYKGWRMVPGKTWVSEKSGRISKSRKRFW